MSALVKSVTPHTLSSQKAADHLLTTFANRQSNEIVIGLAGPIGCGISSVIEGLRERLFERGYTDVVHIKLSNFLEEALNAELIENSGDEKGTNRFKRYRRLQEAGKSARAKLNNAALLAEFAAREIAKDRTRRRREKEGETSSKDSGGPIIPARIAYLIDQVKRPEEVRLLRAIYRNLFYLLGITRINDKRRDELISEHITPEEAQSLIDIDRLELGEGGQQLDKTLHLADYFIRNDAALVEEKKAKLNRFLDLIHGVKSISPTDAEHGMYAAYAAGLRSACLSRQVGAAISSSTGEILATGSNDVPKAGGGLYSASTKQQDMRCVHMDGQKCFNDLYKRNLRNEIGEIIEQKLRDFTDGDVQLTSEQKSILLDAIYKNSRLKDLIEFSRSVHAEMDAIVSLARIGGIGLEGATLYTTTYPCHNCARHIVASGIMKVFYIEPYEKSLAKDLHKDAIAFEVEESLEYPPKRVEFLHFEGVAPRQFHHVFRVTSRKNEEGRFIQINPREADKVLPEYLDNYQDFETKAAEHLTETIKIFLPPDSKLKG
jgi:deoxycytidylate deaminase